MTPDLLDAYISSNHPWHISENFIQVSDIQPGVKIRHRGADHTVMHVSHHYLRLTYE